MATIPKKDIADRIARKQESGRALTREVIQRFMDEIARELIAGNRIELRDFGVFEVKRRAARVAQNPKTLEKVSVPAKLTVKFKPGRLIRSLKTQN